MMIVTTKIKGKELTNKYVKIMLKQVVTAISKSNRDSLIKGVEYAMLLEIETNGRIVIELYPLVVPGKVIV